MLDSVKEVDFFGRRWQNFTAETLAHVLANEKDTIRLVSGLNLHGLYTAFVDLDFQWYNQNAISHIDGMPLIWLSKLFTSITRESRFSSIELLDRLLPILERNDERVFFIGQNPVIEGAIRQWFQVQYPNLNVQCRHGFFDDFRQEQQCLALIKAFKPSVILVGMGMPLQEAWIRRHYSDLNQISSLSSVIAIGAAMEIYTKQLPTCPELLSNIGLEWLYRLVTSPRRVAFRYLVEPFLLLIRLLVMTFFGKAGVTVQRRKLSELVVKEES